MIFLAESLKKCLNNIKLIATPTVSAKTLNRIPGTIPKTIVFAVEKMIAGGNPNAFTQSVNRNEKTIAHPPNESMYRAVSTISPRFNRSHSVGKKEGATEWITMIKQTISPNETSLTIFIRDYASLSTGLRRILRTAQPITIPIAIATRYIAGFSIVGTTKIPP